MLGEAPPGESNGACRSADDEANREPDPAHPGMLPRAHNLSKSA